MRYNYRNTENDRYFYISKPRPVNEHTNNFCIPRQALEQPAKDFLFEWTNPETGETEKKVLAWHYVNKHVFPLFKWRNKTDKQGRTIINQKTGKPAREKVGYACHMISYQWISNYEDLVKKGLAPAPKLPLEQIKIK